MQPKPIQKPLLIDVDGIATMLRVSHRTARRLVRERGFPAPVRLRGCIRWWKAEVLKHVREKSNSENASGHGQQPIQPDQPPKGGH